MAKTKILLTIALLSVVIANTDCVGISSKLDFGDEEKPREIATTLNKNIIKTLFNLSHAVTLNNRDSSKITHVGDSHSNSDKTNKDSQNFSGIGVVCTSGSCNFSKRNDSDTISTDIHVHIETNIGNGSKNNQTNVSNEDDEDVPVIVGLGGVSKNDYIPEPDPDRNSNHHHHVYNKDKTNYSVASFNTKTDSNLNTAALVVSALDPSFQFNERVDGIPGVISILDSNLAVTPKLNEGSKFHVIVENKNSNDDSNNFKQNGIELKIPYFEPSFNNHYFGENPPPQFVWLKKHDPNVYNPYSFKVNTSPTRTYSTLTIVKPTVVGFQQNQNKNQQTCTCTTHHGQGGTGANHGLHWYPSPSDSVDDKLDFNTKG